MESEQTNNLQQWIEDEGYLVNPTLAVLRELADSLAVGEGRVNILIKESVLRSIDREYTQASQLAWLVDNGVIEFREITGEYQTNLVATESVTGAFLTLEGLTVGVATDDEELADQVLPMATELWDGASELTLRSPSHEVVENTFTDLLGADVYESFVASVRRMEQIGRGEVEGDGNPFTGGQHTHASILVAGAVHEISLRALSRCVEQCFLASTSSLSRVKQRMEDEGYIATTPLQTDVGRPPMQLHVAGLYTGDDIELLAERVYEDLHKDQ